MLKQTQDTFDRDPMHIQYVARGYFVVVHFNAGYLVTCHVVGGHFVAGLFTHGVISSWVILCRTIKTCESNC
jgi:hypothetical protein